MGIIINAKVSIDPEGNTINLPKLMDVYRKDFQNTD